MRIQIVIVVAVVQFFGTAVTYSYASQKTQLHAGAAKVDVSPQTFPVIRNGGFLEADDSRLVDPLHARCLVFDDGTNRLAIVVVDSCMIPLDVCDRAKRLAHERTGIAMNRIMISATHSHSAPSVMDFCLGSRADDAYREFLPGKIAEAIEEANKRVEPAMVGFTAIDAESHTKCRRFITRSDKFLTDPFGDLTVHAMMHPGHLNPDYVGPSGPIDPWLSMLMVQSANGKPIAVLANFSMHYFGGHPGISADYCGSFARKIAEKIAPDDSNFVGIMSQGTSGDLWWGDYSIPEDQKPFADMDQFVDSLVELAMPGLKEIKFLADASIAMAETRMTLRRRIPSEERLAWAKRLNELRGERLPKDRPEVYALQAVYLHEHPTDEVVLQAIRVGDFAITGMPNEVYALTGLKLKRQSPLQDVFNVSLANGACGYIPPPEQHALGGYTTWPATTAGLEVQAEPKIVDAVLRLLEQVSGKERRTHSEADTEYSQAIAESDPVAYWRFADLAGPQLRNSVGDNHALRAQGFVAYHLPGRTESFGKRHDTHAIQLAGGKLVADRLDLIESFTVEFSFLLGTPVSFRGATGTLLTRGDDQIRITGSDSDTPGRLQMGNLTGSTHIEQNRWYHVAFVRNGDFVQIYLDGRKEISHKLSFNDQLANQLIFGGDTTDSANFEGKLDEVAVFNRALTFDQLTTHFRAAGMDIRSPLDDGKLDTSALDPESSQQCIHVRDGYRVELVASEPLVQDPVAIDWGLDGSLWVAEMADYPMGIDGKGQPGGRIRLLRDTDGDGRYDQSSIFLDGVSFPNGVIAWGKGVLVTAAPEIFYAEDVDGDDVADVQESLLSGFIEGNQQLRVNGLRWGLDGWVYCASGSHHAGFGAQTNIYSSRMEKTFELGSRDFRFRPSTGQFEPASGPSQYGRVRDDFGNWFGVQNSQPLWHYVLEDRYVRRNTLVPAIDPRHQVRTPQMPRLYSAKPPQKRFHGFDHAGHYTSACGISIYRDDLLFPRDEMHAFTCEPFHNLVQRHVLTNDGTSFHGERGDDGPIDFFASTDRWTRPVMSRTGPDGALWVVDMYRYMIEHPEWLPESARKEMMPGYRAGEDYGRIYRVVPIDKALRDVPNLSNCSASELAAHLASPNGIVRDLAHHELLQHKHLEDENLETLLVKMANEHRLPAVRIQALSALAQIAKNPRWIATAVTDSSPEVRRHAIRIAEALDAEPVRNAVRHAAEDADPKVRLQAALTLGDWNDDESGNALARIAGRADNDNYTTAAIVSSAVPHYSVLCRVAIESPQSATPIFDSLLKMGMANNRDELAELLAASLNAAAETQGPLREQAIDRIAKWLDSLHAFDETLDSLSTDNSPIGHAAADAINLIESVRRASSNSDSSSMHDAACLLLGRQPGKYGEDIEILASILSPTSSDEIQFTALKSLARIPENKVAGRVLNAWPQALPATRSAMADILISRPNWAKQLVAALEDRSIAVSDLDLSHRQRLAESSDGDIADRSRRLIAEVQNHNNDSRTEIVASYLSAVATIGDSGNGEKLFSANCQSCHTLDSTRKLIGPDLRSLTDRSRAALLTAILNPSDSIDPRYANYNVVIDSGQVVTGIVVMEDANSIELQTASGQREIIARSSIEEIHQARVSLMPNGFETKLAANEMSDLITYLQSL